MKISKAKLKEIIKKELNSAKLFQESTDLEEGMFGLTTDNKCNHQLKQERSKWISKVSALYNALKESTGRQNADSVLDSVGLSAADLRPEEISRLEETEDKYVFDADAIKRWPNPADRKEMCNNKSRRGEHVQWVVRNGKGRCEKA